MQEFTRTPASKVSLAARKLVLGVGINDAWYKTNVNIAGSWVRCPAYKKWRSMLNRVYSPKMIDEHQTYRNVTVCNEWLTFSVFLEWYDNNYVEGYELDKDIKIKGNKEYSQSACLFVTQKVHSLMPDISSYNGEYPQGVGFHKSAGKIRASIKIGKKSVHIGYFSTEEEAAKAYKLEKNKRIELAMVENKSIAVYLKQHLYVI